jgi:photosystem II stability/assembly factor-like uncharacterized protein
MLAGVGFADANTATAVGQNQETGVGAILRTEDGGATWTSQVSGTTNLLLGVAFVDASSGIAVGGQGTILRTVDGGASWTRQLSGIADGLYGVSVADASTWTAVGSGGTIVHTTTGGD